MGFVFTKSGIVIPKQGNILLGSTSRNYFPKGYTYSNSGLSGWIYEPYFNAYVYRDGASNSISTTSTGGIKSWMGYTEEGEKGSITIILKKPLKNGDRFVLSGYFSASMGGSDDYADSDLCSMKIGFTSSPTSTTVEKILLNKSPISADRIHSDETVVHHFVYFCEVKNDILYYTGTITDIDETSPSGYESIGSQSEVDSSLVLDSSKYFIFYHYHRNNSIEPKMSTYQYIKYLLFF